MSWVLTARSGSGVTVGFRNTCLHVHDELKKGEQEDEEGEGREGVVATGHGDVSPEPWKYSHSRESSGLCELAPLARGQ